MENLESDYILDLISQRFKVLADSNRLKVLNCLKSGEMNVTQIIEATGLKQANVSKILNTLAGANIVAKRREGNSVYYRIVDDSIFQLCTIVCDNLESSAAEFSKILKTQNPFRVES